MIGDLSRVRVLVAENGIIVGKSVAGALDAFGFTDIERVGTAAEARAHLTERRIDLVAVNADFDGGAGADLVRAIRNCELHADPFPVILMIVTRPDEARIKAALHSGADDIVVVPFAREPFHERMALYLEGRKPFIVTHDYIGPDRRAAPRPGEASAAHHVVPNPIRSRAMGQGEERYAAAAQAAHRKLTAARASSLAKAVQWEIRAIQAAVNSSAPDSQLALRVARLDQFAEEMIDCSEGDSTRVRGFQAALTPYRRRPEQLGPAEAAALMMQAQAFAAP